MIRQFVVFALPLYRSKILCISISFFTIIGSNKPPLVICTAYEVDNLIMSGLTNNWLVSTRAFTNIQIRCADLYQKWRSCPARCSLLSSVNYLPALIIYGVSRIGIRTSLGVIQIVEGPLLALGIRPAFADTV